MHRDDLTRAVRRQRLQERSTQLRAALCADAHAVAPAFAVADLGLRAAGWLRQHRLIAAGVFGLLLLRRPKAGLRGLRSALLAWGICRRAGAAVRSALASWRQLRG